MKTLGKSAPSVFRRSHMFITIRVDCWGKSWGGMARQVNRLSARAVSTVSKPGRHADGNGLYLGVDPSGAKRWLFLFRWGGKLKEMGLGGLSAVRLGEGRERAGAARRGGGAGGDPIGRGRATLGAGGATVGRL